MTYNHMVYHQHHYGPAPPPWSNNTIMLYQQQNTIPGSLPTSTNATIAYQLHFHSAPSPLWSNINGQWSIINNNLVRHQYHVPSKPMVDIHHHYILASLPWSTNTTIVHDQHQYSPTSPPLSTKTTFLHHQHHYSPAQPLWSINITMVYHQQHYSPTSPQFKYCH